VRRRLCCAIGRGWHAHTINPRNNLRNVLRFFPALRESALEDEMTNENEWLEAIESSLLSQLQRLCIPASPSAVEYLRNVNSFQIVGSRPCAPCRPSPRSASASLQYGNHSFWRTLALRELVNLGARGL
jgi:hypothetical protein